ncbi:MAG TPA: hypothetical protein VG329_08070 [Candidatus Dormibacteraeota bacterium]|jgi:maltokinase|nr:hypothetical protein [Candidatus Dormibacteraeota bacterium]
MSQPESPADLLKSAGLPQPESQLMDYLRRQRWFSGKDREIERVVIEDAGIAEGEPSLVPVLLRAEYADSGWERYSLPLSVRPAANADYRDAALVAEGLRDGEPVVVLDALLDRQAAARFWGLLEGADPLPTLNGELAGSGAGRPAHDAEIHTLPRDQSNTMLVRGETELLKCFRKLEGTSSPEFEMLEALKDAGFGHIPTPLGLIEYRTAAAEPVVVAMLQPYLHNATDGWAIAMTSLRDLYAAADESEVEDEAEIRDLVDDQGSDFTPDAARLGAVIAEMHLALAGDSMPEPMRAQPAGPTDLRAWADDMLADLETLARADRNLAAKAAREGLRRRIDAIADLPEAGLAIRVHGDLHLGQTARTDDGWVILDFEGEPSRSVEARRRRASALKDVAGILRSLDYASAVALLNWTNPDDPRWTRLQRFGDAWARVNQEALWDTYVATVGASPLLPPAEMAPALLDAYEVQKALYELAYELNHRPDWAWIPLRYLESPA